MYTVYCAGYLMYTVYCAGYLMYTVYCAGYRERDVISRDGTHSQEECHVSGSSGR